MAPETQTFKKSASFGILSNSLIFFGCPSSKTKRKRPAIAVAYAGIVFTGCFTRVRQDRSCNRSLFPQGGVAGQETKVSVPNASHWMEPVQEYLVDAAGQAADKIAVPLP